MGLVLGVSATEQQIILDILREYMQDFSFYYYYGSRVKGSHSAVSHLTLLHIVLCLRVPEFRVLASGIGE